MKALIVGLLSFAVVAALGGAAVTNYFLPATPPAFGSSAVERGEMPAKPFASRAKAENAAAADAPREASAAAATSRPADAPASSLALAPKLEVSEHLDATGGGSSAELRFKDKVVDEEKVLEARAAAAVVKKARGAAKPDGRDAAVASSVHYGVTSRSELMTRANGPVSNFKGRRAKTNAPVGTLAGDAGAKLADIQKQLDAATLPEADRAKLKKELDPLSKDLEAAMIDDGAQ